MTNQINWWLTILVWGSMLFAIGSSVVALMNKPPVIGKMSDVPNYGNI